MASQFPSRQPRRQNTAPSGSPSHRRNDESWVEVASQPSSSSLSSIGDEIVTTGLRVGSSGSYPPRRRRLQQQLHQQQGRPVQQAPQVGSAYAGGLAETSSQEEYDETESDEDRVMTSSNERPATANLNRQSTAFVSAAADCASDEDDDDDENSTALGRPSNSPTFRPQPNAFSHPPSHPQHRHSTGSSAPNHHPYLPHSSASQRSRSRAHRNFMSPSYRADNDEALRASLTTLLSCAAAARGRPRMDDGFEGATRPGGLGAGTGIMPSSDPVDLRLVPESELMRQGPPPSNSPIPPHLRQQQQQKSPPPGSSKGQASATAEKSKRPPTPQSGRSPRATKKKRTASDSDSGATTTFISPTILTWVVSAGVLVLVSVVGFGAGYVIGREVGRQEGAAASLGGVGSTTHDAAANASSCGRELAKSGSGGTLRRFKWSAVAKSVTA